MTAALTAEKFAEAAEILSLSENHRVLTRFVPDPAVYVGWAGAIPDGCKTGVFVDVETTGLNVRTDKITEFSLVPFVFDADGVIYDAGKGLSYLNDPGMPIAPEVTALTGITDEMVKGYRIDVDAVRPIVEEAAIVIAHHADFDRKMCEREMPFFRTKHWACSQIEVPWKETFACQAAKLAIILADACRQFSDARHRAVEDCHVGVNVLANARVDGRPALSFLLESARQSTCRVWAVDSPFPKKDMLKQRGYFWSAPEDAGRKCWYRDVRPEELDDEIMWCRDIAGARPDAVRFGSKDRYSVRVL